MKKEILVFHGTRADPNSIREKGLIAGGLDRKIKDPLTERYIVNKEATLQRVLGEFGLRKEEIPEWCYRGELQYEKDDPIHIHFEMSFDNAIGYADMGGEPAYLIRYHIRTWLEAKKLGDETTCLWHLDRKLSREVNRWAKEANGKHTYVVAVKLDLDDPRVDKQAVETIRRIEKVLQEGKFHVGEDIWKHPMEIKYYGDIAPERILGIVQVDPLRGYL